ncbi:LOW QUALITY PROTEIN: hypothetical protein Cgig2_016323 [Carnegiea gigantea]|uniref:Uncharacterized protein n=1 Tax=Carnegiea gigantea TaxID=171969 RepID=A0A9Q1Q5G7_9CARY|nr:LOW QUALITY PROTEIN: hypothetical protein Cgig2_016323 [Carnegiea gigantea]
MHLRRSSSRTFSASTATCSAMPSSDSRGDNFTLTCSAQDKGESVPLEKSLRISKPMAAKTKSLAKYFSLRSQFIGSFSLDLLCFRPLLGIHHLSHEFRYWPRTVILLNIEMEVASCPFLIVYPTRFTAYKEKVIFLVFNLGLFLDSHHGTLLVIKAIPPKIPSLTRGPLDQMGLRKCTACAGQPT